MIRCSAPETLAEGVVGRRRAHRNVRKPAVDEHDLDPRLQHLVQVGVVGALRGHMGVVWRVSRSRDPRDFPVTPGKPSAGALLGVMRAVPQERAGRDAADHHAALVLRMLGLSADDAAEVAARPLPEVSRP